MPQRSPIIFWLLVAATLSVDAVAVSWLLRPPQSDPTRSIPSDLEASYTFFFALAASQISVVAIASVFVERRTWQRWLAPFAVALVAVIVTCGALPFNGGFDGTTLVTWLVVFELHALPLMGALLLVSQYHSVARRWQFSLWHLLLLMTVAAVVVVAAQSTELVATDWRHLAAMISSSVLLAAFAVVIYRSIGHGLLRLAALVGVALIMGWGLNSTDLIWEWRAFTLIQAAILWLWLQWGGLIASGEIYDHDQQSIATEPRSLE